MLRRTERVGPTESWILIPQIEHAHLAGALAESWGDSSLAELQPREEVQQAVRHHDDGWADWDASPGVDPAVGRPLSFVEMPLDVSIDIWRRSIFLACSRGYLAAHMVSNHFTELLQRASPRWSHDPERFQTSRQFLDEQSEHREIWLAKWQTPNPAVRTRKMAALALEYLQFFDALSLWFCGAVRRGPQSFATPEGYEVTFNPTGPLHFTAQPWPLTVGRMSWTVNARRVPVGVYRTQEELASTFSEAVELTFQLTAEA
ncbi:MAG TPA: DUF3891 family protein [Pirellulales bacterium]|nr:DUF3891 family protein [Pirellulales bacterium]